MSVEQSEPRHGALWLAVRLSVALEVVQVWSHSQGGAQVTTRHTTGP